MLLSEIIQQQPGFAMKQFPALIKKIYPAEAMPNPQYSTHKQNIYITDPGQPTIPDAKCTLWLDDIGAGMPTTYQNQVVTLEELKFKPYNNKPQFEIKWTLPGYVPPQTYTPPAQAMPPAQAQSFHQPPQGTAALSTYPAPGAMPYTPPTEPIRDMIQECIAMQSQMKCAIQFLQGKQEVGKEEVVKTAQFFARACLDGVPKPSSGNAVADAFADQYDLPNDDIEPPPY